MQHKWRIWLGLGVMVCGLAGFGYWLYDGQLHRSRLPIHERLNAIVRMKAEQISAWRRERVGDAEVLRLNAPLTREARRWLEGTAAAGEREEMTAYLEQMSRQFRYAGFLLIDAQGGIRHSSLAIAESRLDAEGHEAVMEAWRARRAILSDLHIGGEFPYPHLALVAPLFRDTEPAGAILLLIDARTTLFPLVQAWPGVSPSAEIALIRRDGDAMLFLSDLRYRPDAALKLRQPLNQRDLPVARIVLGERGAIEGRDYRGVPVLVAGQPVPDSPWFVAAKVDAEEILAPARREALIPLALMVIAVLLLGGGAGAVAVWRQRQHEASLRRLESERQASLQQFANIFEQALDGILLLTADHLFLDANPAALRMLGYRRDELLGLRLPAILAENERPRLKMEVPAMMTGTPHHQEWLHQRKDGSTFIGAVTALALDEQRYFAMLRDLTEQKQHENRERAQTRVLNLVAQGAALPTVLEALVTSVEEYRPGMRCGILLLDESGQHLIHGAAPSLPDFWNQAVDGLAIGPDIGSCAAAAYTGQRVIVRDVQTHPNWAPFRELTARAGLAACWSEPIKSSAGTVLGVFAIYYPEPREPGPADLQLIEQSANLAAIALERSRTQQALELRGCLEIRAV
ncbi:MAG: GAF domain-containing protein [Methylococcus sp.]